MDVCASYIVATQTCGEIRIFGWGGSTAAGSAGLCIVSIVNYQPPPKKKRFRLFPYLRTYFRKSLVRRVHFARAAVCVKMR
jgi:hypothetical protein